MSQKWSVINEFLGLTIYNLVKNSCKAQDTITVQGNLVNKRHTPGPLGASSLVIQKTCYL